MNLMTKKKAATFAALIALAMLPTATAEPPEQPPGGTLGCLFGYHPNSYANICIVDPGREGENLCFFEEDIPCIRPVLEGSICPIGQLCIPIPGVDFGPGNTQFNAEVYVEVLCNQPDLTCDCETIFGVQLVTLCAPVA